MAEVSQAQGQASADATAARENLSLYEKPDKLPLPEVLALTRDPKSTINIKLSLLLCEDLKEGWCPREIQRSGPSSSGEAGAPLNLSGNYSTLSFLCNSEKNATASSTSVKVAYTSEQAWAIVPEVVLWVWVHLCHDSPHRQLSTQEIQIRDAKSWRSQCSWGDQCLLKLKESSKPKFLFWLVALMLEYISKSTMVWSDLNAQSVVCLENSIVGKC